jgi:glucan phosphorylase
MDLPSQLTPDRPIAFFSAEYGIENNLPIYAGGLGVLSGDIVLEAASDNVPLVALGILYRKGFETGSAQASAVDPMAAGFALIEQAPGVALTVEVTIAERIIKVQAWEKHYNSARLILLDTAHPENTAEDQTITARLYDPDFTKRATQEWVFGAGSIALLRKLGITPSIYHLNEGHMGFVGMALILEYIQAHPGVSPADAQAAIRPGVVASKHTILSGAGLFIDRMVLKSIMGAVATGAGASFDELFALTTALVRPDHFSGTKFILGCAIRVNGVSKLHVAKEKQEHPDSRLIPITNGVHRRRWQAANLFTGSNQSAEEIWKRHQTNRSNLIATINDTLGAKLDPNALTVVWARRITPYKRPTLLFNNIQRLEKLISNHDEQPIQFIIAGKANSGDPEAQQILDQILQYCSYTTLAGRVVYMPGYSVPTTKQLVAGADVWLNTPIRGQEACGTSGMKASLNGALQLSTSDGWIDEVDVDCIGWKLPEEGIESALYDTLKQIVAPTFYRRDAEGIPQEWTAMMQQTIGYVSEHFSATRMLDDYIHKLYFPQG